jgi:DNA repair exonuclease SbcCD ATPase subunit
MDEATEQATTEQRDGGHDDDAARIEQLEATVEQLRKDLWTARDAVIGAEAEAGALKVQNRQLEVLIAQLRDALAAQTRWARLVGRLTGNRYVSTLITRLKSLLRP